VIAHLGRLVTGRVARRLFLLFALSAFVPLATLAVLSLNEVRSVLLQQGERRLASNAKSYGMAVFERLLLAQEVAAAAAGHTQGSLPRESIAGRIFVSVGTFDADGRATIALGQPSQPTLDAEALSRLAQGRPVIVVGSPGAPARVNLVVTPPGVAARLVVGELSPDYLWGSADQFPAATDFCILEEGSRVALFCPAPGAAVAMPAAGYRPAESALQSVRWSRDGEPHRAIAWGQFMRAAFGTPDWVFIASQPESYQLVPVTEFTSVYVPAVALALLLATWFSLRQARSILVPVDTLAARARAIAKNDFATRLDMQRDDEFGELANAFDHMSGRLGRQFAAITALAEIDRLILATLDTDQVVRTVLRRLGEMFPAETIAVTLTERESPDRALTYLRSAGALAQESVANAWIAAPDRSFLEAHPRGARLGEGDAWPAFLAGLRERGSHSAFVQPIAWRGSVCGALALGFRAAAPGEGEAEQLAREFADRVAVAVSSAWRDEQLYLQAHFDTLTGLPNRMLFRDRLEREVVRCQRESGRLALLFIDLDNFKSVNDSCGHTAGDEVLREAGQRIARCVRESDTVSRLGGDEFTVLLTRVQRPQDASRVADQITAALSAEYRTGAHQAYLSASVGIAYFPGDGETAEELLRNADTAMYRAKGSGRATVVYFEDRMNAEALARHTLDRDLRLAIDRGELQLHYQPLVDVPTGRIRSAEALLRWNHPVHGLIPPARFIPVAEETGVIELVGQLVIIEACRQLKAWEHAGLGIERVAINVSPRQFRKPGLVDFVRDCLVSTGVSPGMLELEITEGMLVDQADVARDVLGMLAAIGITIALDDFGTGFSSMAYLTRFPVHAIKVDRVFVDGLGRSVDSEAIVSAIVAMSRALGKRVVAEGVETAEQLAILGRLGCDSIQGHLISPALPAEAFAAFVKARPQPGDAPRRIAS